MIGGAAYDMEAGAAAGIRVVYFEGGSLLECVEAAFAGAGVRAAVPA